MKWSPHDEGEVCGRLDSIDVEEREGYSTECDGMSGRESGASKA